MSRIAVAVLVAILAGACYNVRTVPITYLDSEQPGEIYVSTGGAAQRVQHPHLASDTLRGTGDAGAIVIPARDVTAVEVRWLNGTRTGALIAGILGASAIIVYGRYDDLVEDVCDGDTCQDVLAPKNARPDGY